MGRTRCKDFRHSPTAAARRLFSTAFLLFAKLFPVIAMAEVKHILKTSGEAQKKAQLEEVRHAHDHQPIPQTI